MRTRVKICGLRKLSDVAVAANAGADALGFVFYPPSPRAVNADCAASLMQSVPSFITNVGLFVNASAANIERVLAKAPIQVLQFHGDESPAFCQQFQLPYIKAVRMKAGTNLHRLRDDYGQASGLLLDAYQQGVPGGTGMPFHWQVIPQDMRSEIILAGGLDEHNVAQAIADIRPYAVDVSGGVETLKGEKGQKDHVRINHFMQAVCNGYSNRHSMANNR